MESRTQRETSHLITSAHLSNPRSSHLSCTDAQEMDIGSLSGTTGVNAYENLSGSDAGEAADSREVNSFLSKSFRANWEQSEQPLRDDFSVGEHATFVTHPRISSESHLLRPGTTGDEFRASDDDGPQSIFGQCAHPSPEDLRCERSISTSKVSSLPTMKETGNEKGISGDALAGALGWRRDAKSQFLQLPRKGKHSPWQPWILQSWTLLSFVVLYALMIVALILLYVFSQRNQGLANSTWNQHYYFTYGPTACE